MNDKILERIAIALEKLAGVEEELGVVNIESMASRTTIYAAGANDIQQGIPWYELGENDTHISYAGKVIKGRLVDVRKVVKTGEFGDKEKLEIELESFKEGKPHTYIIAAGFTSVLSASVLQKLTAINDLKQGHIVGIYAEAGKRAVMSKVFSGSNNSLVWCDWDESYDNNKLLAKLRNILGFATVASSKPVTVPSSPSPSIPASEVDRNLLYAEVRSLQKRKNIPDKTINGWSNTRFKVDLNRCTTDQLIQIKAGIANYTPKVSQQ